MMFAEAVEEVVAKRLKKVVSVMKEDVPEFSSEWMSMAEGLLACATREEFFQQNYQLRLKEKFVEPVKIFVSAFMAAGDTRHQLAAQSVLQLFCEKLLIFKTHLNLQEEQPQQNEVQAVETTGAAHRFYVGFILRQLGDKFGVSMFEQFKMDGESLDLEAAGLENLWWTAGVNRGKLYFPCQEFYNFFTLVLDIENKFFRKQVRSTVMLKKLLEDDVVLCSEWCRLPWGDNVDDVTKERARKEGIRIHLGGRSRSFVRYVKEGHKTAKRMVRTKKPLRKELATK